MSLLESKRGKNKSILIGVPFEIISKYLLLVNLWRRDVRKSQHFPGNARLAAVFISRDGRAEMLLSACQCTRTL